MVKFTIITSVALSVQLALLAQISIGLPINARPEEKGHCKRSWIDYIGPGQLGAGVGIGCIGSLVVAAALGGCYFKCIRRGHTGDVEAPPGTELTDRTSIGSPHTSAPPSQSDPEPSTLAGTHPQDHRSRDLPRRQFLDDHEKREWDEPDSRDLDLDELD